MFDAFSDVHPCDDSALTLVSETREGATGYRLFRCGGCGENVADTFDAGALFERGPTLSRWAAVVAELGEHRSEAAPRDDLEVLVAEWTGRSVA